MTENLWRRLIFSSQGLLHVCPSEVVILAVEGVANILTVSLEPRCIVWQPVSVITPANAMIDVRYIILL